MPSHLLVRVCFIKKKNICLTFILLHPTTPHSLPKLAVHSEPFCLWLHHLPLKEVLWFWSRGCWSAWPVPFRPVWFQLGGLHSSAGARWGCPDGYLEWCVMEVPCWCFCSCCFTCWMISLIFLCAVCKTRAQPKHTENMTIYAQKSLYI